MENQVVYKLVANKGEEQLIPKCGLIQDSRYFTLESLIEMYGQEAVDKFFKRERTYA